MQRDKIVEQDGPDDYAWEVAGRIRAFNKFVWVGAERFLRENAKNKLLTDQDLEGSRIRLQLKIKQLVDDFLNYLVKEEQASSRLIQHSAFVELPSALRVNLTSSDTIRTRRYYGPSTPQTPQTPMNGTFMCN